MIYKRAIQRESTKNLRQSESTVLQEDTKIALFHLEKKKGGERVTRAVFYEHMKHCEYEIGKRAIQAKEPEDKDK